MVGVALSVPTESSGIWHMVTIRQLHRMLDTLHVVVCIYMMYWYLITNYGNPNELLVVHWTFEVRAFSVRNPFDLSGCAH